MSEEIKQPENTEPVAPKDYGFKDYGYEVLEKGTGVFDSKLRKSKVTIDFTLNDINTHIAQLKDEQSKFAGQVKVQNAMKDNIKRNHPEIAEFFEGLVGEKRAAALLFADAETKLSKFEPMLESQNEVIAESQAEVDYIMETLGLKVDAPIVSPYAGEKADGGNEPATA
jgi:hypothetical protein